ncbi:unnamed protein product [Brassicogethes aeneus]|uniref:Cuticle protein n=1 Tax=Brassicogethes aeneus TaxID=1431903 RepID=A0A9P0FFT0_BRAAE|nr:unnamed protein product [Brassicogethes aeneus]
MAFKFVVFAAFVAVARAGNLGYAAAPLGYAASSLGYAAQGIHSYAHAAPVLATHGINAYSHGYSAPIAYAAPVVKSVVADAPAHYDYGYSVSDPHTGDHKSAVETRRGDAVQGQYSLVDSDGTKRTVDYTADAVNGFNAVVSKTPLAHHVVAAPAVATYAAPVAAHYAHAAPVAAHYAHVAPVAAHYAHSAPVAAHYAHSAPVAAHYAHAPVSAHYAHAAPVAYSGYAHPVAQAW